MTDYSILLCEQCGALKAEIYELEQVRDSLRVDLSVARQSLYEVVGQRNSLLARVALLEREEEP